MKTLIRGTAALSLLATASLALAQPPQQEPSLMTYDMAMSAIDAAEAHARDNGWDVTILVTDQNANPVMMRRLDGAAPFTYTIAQRKSMTVIATGLTTAEYATRLEAGEIEEIENGANFGGGVPVFVDGELVGSVSASGVQPGQDEEVSRAGAEAIGSVSAD